MRGPRAPHFVHSCDKHRDEGEGKRAQCLPPKPVNIPERHMNRHLSTRSAALCQKGGKDEGAYGLGNMDVQILARRFTIITLFAALFAISFSAAVVHGGGGGAQSHFGANYTCLESSSPFCSGEHK